MQRESGPPGVVTAGRVDDQYLRDMGQAADGGFK
jgi:hypothetical protein